MRTAPAILALAVSLAFAAPSARAQLTLDVSGGIMNENWNFTVTGGNPGQYWVIGLADTMGPLPINFLTGDNDPRSWDLDVTMFSYPAGIGTLPATNPVWQFQNVYAGFEGYYVYCQAFTAPGFPFFIDELSNDVVIVVAPGHGAAVDTVGKPVRSRAFMPGAPLSNGNQVIFGGNDGALSGGTYLKSVELFARKLQTITSDPSIPNMSIERSFHRAQTLNDGRVLVAGGNDDLNNVLTSAEIYDSNANTFTTTGSMAQKRYFHSMVKLSDGRVMVLGGSTAVDASGSQTQAALAIVNSATDSCEIYNPATGTWSAAAAMPWKRTGISAALLSNGKVLACTGAGSFLGIPIFTTTAALYNPTTNSWQSIAALNGTGRALSTVSTLANGKIMISGGANGNIASLTLNALADVSIYDPVANAWQSNPPSLLGARVGHMSTLLPNGNIAITGGAAGNIFFPVVTKDVDSFNGSAWTNIGMMNHERAFHYAALSYDSERIFLYGGIESGGNSAVFPTAEYFAY
ncbi:MAG: hypothetical protein HY286_18200 [Planctomycetes bacterium]|nr:hypothetical protein [Planctomycetota bacterium]